MRFRNRMTARGIIRTSFAFSADDETALSTRVALLNKAGHQTKAVTVLRALIYMTPESDLIARCVRLTADLALKGETEPATSSRPTVGLDKEQIDKLDEVVSQLSRANIVATRTFVVRALLRESPRGTELAQLYEKFVEAFPFKPRGLSKLRLEKKARGTN